MQFFHKVMKSALPLYAAPWIVTTPPPLCPVITILHNFLLSNDFYHHYTDALEAVQAFIHTCRNTVLTYAPQLHELSNPLSLGS